ncbi:hypothetical protein Sjap_017618 [Stephania japonica]|uniref:Uncharacterized protein n=1 Tax=Stephania japonica TaxID=461633 RepID=A0AAP0I6I1_9MAGN
MSEMTTLSFMNMLSLILLWAFASEMRFCVSSKVYVVYMGSTSNEDPEQIQKQHHQMLQVIHGGCIEDAQASHVYSYKHGFKGFAAKLTAEQAEEMTRMPGVVSVFPNSKRMLHTTRSWDFMGFSANEATPIPGYSAKNLENVIVGVIDTGIWPECPSFRDHGMSPVPSTWKGKCEVGEAFNISTCNRKLIGARYYLGGYEAEGHSTRNPKQYRSARDKLGHGSHTASTAAGRFVPNVSFKKLGSGNARGGAALARIAVYKTCWESGCFDVDLLAAFDDAIRDGVHVISVSLGPEAPQADYFKDAVSIGSFHAVKHGITVVSSAGNEGFLGSGYATNLAPWIITVGASTTDRDFISDVVLGDGTKLTGESLVTFGMNASAGIISAADANAGYFTPYQSSYCLESSLNKTKTRGKILVCRHTGDPNESKLEKSNAVKKVGGIGMVLIDEADESLAVPFVIPAAIVGNQKGERILTYINHTGKPTAQIMPATTVLGHEHSPRVAAFSSRGPNSLNPEILKPDVTAPGLNIIAAWSPAAAQKFKFNIISGTSMACPHVTGMVALIKALYPSWSPAAIKSAIMTTATTFNKKGKPITVDPDGRIGNPFDYGSGFVNPSKAVTPGLIYDAKPVDYRTFLCSIGYDEELLHLVTGDNSTCNKVFSTASDLNYPSISVPNLRDSHSVVRTVTNVGEPNSTYRAVVSSPRGINITVTPMLLNFNSKRKKINFTVNFKLTAPSTGYLFGSLTWRTDKICVTSPLVVRVGSSNSGLLR